MPTTPTRIHQKVDDAEIALVLRCKDSHEFYERYVKEFPKKRKGIESIGKIWKRRSEFLKKQQAGAATAKQPEAVPKDIEALLALQQAQLAELCALAKEQLQVSKEILAALKRQAPHQEEPQAKRKVTGIIIPQEPPKKEPVKELAKKKVLAKPSPILIGS
jgi:hypothetical protein